MTDKVWMNVAIGGIEHRCEESFLDDDIICPYCYAVQDPQRLDGLAQRRIDCEKCYFTFKIVSAIKYKTRKAECLNGVPDHNFGDWIPRDCTHIRKCFDCGFREAKANEYES